MKNNLKNIIVPNLEILKLTADEIIKSCSSLEKEKLLNEHIIDL